MGICTILYIVASHPCTVLQKLGAGFPGKQVRYQQVCGNTKSINWLEKKIKVSFAGLKNMRQDTLKQHITWSDEVQKIKANHEETLSALYYSNYHKVEHFVIQNSGTAEEAKDVYQEAFLSVWRNIQLGSEAYTTK